MRVCVHRGECMRVYVSACVVLCFEKKMKSCEGCMEKIKSRLMVLYCTYVLPAVGEIRIENQQKKKAGGGRIQNIPCEAPVE